MSDQTSFITGLANGLNVYMGMDQKNQYANQQQQAKFQNEFQIEQFKNDLETKRQKANSDNELDRQKQFEAYKQSLGGSVDPDTAASIDPAYGAISKNFQIKNGRAPTVHELHEMGSLSRTGQGQNLIQPDTLANLGKLMGADDATVAQLGQIKGGMQVGLAEQALKGIMDKGVGDKEIWGLYKDMNRLPQDATPDMIGQDFQRFKVGIQEPGKETLTTDSQFDAVITGANKFVQDQVSQGVPRATALANAAQKASVYDKKTKARLLFRLTAQNSQQGQ